VSGGGSPQLAVPCHSNRRNITFSHTCSTTFQRKSKGKSLPLCTVERAKHREGASLRPSEAAEAAWRDPRTGSSSVTQLHANVCLLCAVNRLLRCQWSTRSAEDHEIYSLLHPQPLLAGRARPAVGDVPPRPQCRGKATTMVVILSTWCAAVSTPPLHALPTAASRPHVLLIPTFSPGCVGRHLSAGHLDAFLTRSC
jgi:hypothetical protein